MSEAVEQYQLDQWRRDAERMSDIEWEADYWGRPIVLALLREIDRLTSAD